MIKRKQEYLSLLSNRNVGYTLHYFSRLMPSNLAVNSQVTIAAAFAGKALANVGPRPV